MRWCTCRSSYATDSQQTRSEERGLEQLLLYKLQKDPTLSTPWSGTSIFQSYKTIHFCCVWPLVCDGIPIDWYDSIIFSPQWLLILFVSFQNLLNSFSFCRLLRAALRGHNPQIVLLSSQWKLPIYIFGTYNFSEIKYTFAC